MRAIQNVIIFTLMAVGLFFCKEEKKEIQIGDTVFLSGDKVRLRSGPSTSSPAITQFRLGEQFVVTEKSEKTDVIGGTNAFWYKIENDKKNSGWIFGQFLSLEKVEPLDELRKNLKGTYYFCTSAQKKDCTHIIEISEEEYSWKKFDSNYGLIDKYTGTVSYSSMHLTLSPQARFSRYAFYQYSLPYEQQDSYDPYAYGVSHEDNALVDLELDKGPAVKMYILRCDGKIILTEIQDEKCDLNHSAYYR